MTKQNKKESLTKKDLWWIIGILIGIIIIVLSVRLSDNRELINIVSFISSGVSIALALVAIEIALKQDNNSNIINARIQETLGKMSEKINNVDNKVSNIDFHKVMDKYKDYLKDSSQDFVSSLNEINKEDNDYEVLVSKAYRKFENEIENIDIKVKKKFEKMFNENTNIDNLYSFDVKLKKYDNFNFQVFKDKLKFNLSNKDILARIYIPEYLVLENKDDICVFVTEFWLENIQIDAEEFKRIIQEVNGNDFEILQVVRLYG